MAVDSGFRIQESGVRMKTMCFLLSAFCILPTAYFVSEELA